MDVCWCVFGTGKRHGIRPFFFLLWVFLNMELYAYCMGGIAVEWYADYKHGLY